METDEGSSTGKKRGLLRWALLGSVVTLGVLLAVMVANALRAKSRQLAVSKAQPIAIKPAQTVTNISVLLKLRTESKRESKKSTDPGVPDRVCSAQANVSQDPL